VLTFRGLEQSIATARDAARSGRLDEATRAYAGAIVQSPDSAFLYRELAAVERRKGEVDAALADFRKAVALDPTDASSLVQIGDILDERGEFEAALKTYDDALAIEGSREVEAKIDAVRARTELARLPAEYRAIETAPQVTRADLAGLVGVRLSPLLDGAQPREAVVVTDVRNTWATEWIMMVARAGVMEPFANHTFQPGTLVRRTDLAQVVSRLLPRVPAVTPATLEGWRTSRLRFADLSTGHLAYPAASMAVSAGVMTMGADNAFQPSRPVTGAEASDAIAKVQALAGLPSLEGKARR
jgi:hypothetical protein